MAIKICSHCWAINIDSDQMLMTIPKFLWAGSRSRQFLLFVFMGKDLSISCYFKESLNFAGFRAGQRVSTKPGYHRSWLQYHGQHAWWHLCQSGSQPWTCHRVRQGQTWWVVLSVMLILGISKYWKKCPQCCLAFWNTFRNVIQNFFCVCIKNCLNCISDINSWLR